MICCDQTWVSVSKYSVPFHRIVMALHLPMMHAALPAVDRPAPASGIHPSRDSGKRLASLSILRI